MGESAFAVTWRCTRGAAHGGRSRRHRRRAVRSCKLEAAMKLPLAWVPVLLTSAVGKSAVERTERAADGRGAAGGCCSGPVAVAAC